VHVVDSMVIDPGTIEKKVCCRKKKPVSHAPHDLRRHLIQIGKIGDFYFEFIDHFTDVHREAKRRDKDEGKREYR